MEQTQEKSLQRETVKIDISPAIIPFNEIDADVQLAVRCAGDKKAVDIKVLDLRQIATFTEYFIIASGSNQRQVQAISDEINEQLKKQLNSRAIRIEGHAAGEWVLLDYGDFIVHVFDKEAREFYDLERLWLDAGRVEVPSDV